MAQTFFVPVCRAQRLILFELAHAPEAPKLSGADGRRYRRFCEAFGIDVIAATVRATGGRLNPATVADEEGALHQLTAENVEFALRLLPVPRSALHEDVIGPLFDLLEAIHAGQAPEPVTTSEGWGIPEYEPDRALWVPQPSKDELQEARDRAA